MHFAILAVEVGAVVSGGVVETLVIIVVVIIVSGGTDVESLHYWDVSLHALLVDK